MILDLVLIDVLLGLGAGLLWTRSEPTILLRRWLGWREEDYDTYSEIKRFIHRGLNCLPCSTFWLTLLVTGNPLAMLAGLPFAYLMDRWG
jgi:hypothetical protein